MTAAEEYLQENRERGVKWTVLVLCVFMVTVLALFLKKFNTPRVLTESELKINGTIQFKQPRIIKDFELVNHHGDAFSLNSLEGKWTLMFFGFTYCPDVCPTAMSEIDEFISTLNADVQRNTQVVFVSVDPARDTVEKMATYVPYFNKDFIGVTGEFLEIKRLSGQLNIAFAKVPQGDSYTIDHSANVAIINPYGHYHGFFRAPLNVPKMKLTFQSMVTMFDHNNS